MSTSEVIEIAGEAVAVARPEQSGVRFVAVKFNVWPLDNELYEDVDAARRAAFAHIAGKAALRGIGRPRRAA